MLFMCEQKSILRTALNPIEMYSRMDAGEIMASYRETKEDSPLLLLCYVLLLMIALYPRLF